MLLFGAIHAEIELDEGVLVLTEKNFDEAINSNQYILVEFYAPWCGHCKSLAPEYAKAAKKLASEGSQIKLGKVDATVESELGQKFQVRGYPSLKFFVDGAPVEYKGGRTEHDIVTWVKKKAQPKVRPVKDVDAFEDEIRDNDVVAVFWGLASHKNFPIFEGVSRNFDEVEFIYTNDDETREKYQSEPEVLVTVYKRFDEGRVDFDGPLDLDQLKDFINNHQFPVVMDFNDKAAERMFGQSAIPSMLLFVDHGNRASEEPSKYFREAAENLKGRAYFAIVDVHNHESNRIMEFFGIKKEDVPQVRIAAQGNQGFEKFRTEEELTTEGFAQFLKDHQTGNVRPYLKGEPIPADNGDAVKIIVRDNWKKTVLDPAKDVLIELYAPWCGHCQRLSPIWEKVAQRVSKIPNLVIAKMDATANEVEGIQISSYPTLKFYPAFKKHAPIEVKVDHNEEAIIEWLKKHISKKYSEDL